jgi:hypothetical protein
MHAAREEAEGVEATAAGLEMRAARLLVAALGTHQERTDTLQTPLAVVGVKRQHADQRVGGVADLAQGDRRVFPPAAAQSGGPGRDD